MRRRAFLRDAQGRAAALPLTAGAAWRESTGMAMPPIGRVAFVPAAFLLLLTFPRAAEACSCMGGIPLCETFWKTPVVFAGQVLDISDAGDGAKPLFGRRVRV